MALKNNFNIGYKWELFEIISEKKRYGGLSKRSYYECKCECGVIKKLRSDFINKVKSCGCKKVYFSALNCPRTKGSILEEDGKLCAKCFIKKPATDFPFHKSDKKNNLYCWCIICVRNENLIKQYDITYEKYKKILNKQNGKCAICNKKESFSNRKNKDELCVDHCHKTENLLSKKQSIRGLLCYKCNLAIGMLGDNLEGVLKVVRYLRKFENKIKKIIKKL